jgi:hypothetical protein
MTWGSPQVEPLWLRNAWLYAMRCTIEGFDELQYMKCMSVEVQAHTSMQCQVSVVPGHQ